MTNSSFSRRNACAIIAFGLMISWFTSLSSLRADSATWLISPNDSNWNENTNWTPNATPNGAGQVATFLFSHDLTPSVTQSTQIGSIVYTAASSDYDISVGTTGLLDFTGAGIVNNSGLIQAFTITPSAVAPVVPASGASVYGVLDFQNGATAGNNTSFTSAGGEDVNPPYLNRGFINFFDTSNAGSGSFTAQGSSPVGTNNGNVYGGGVNFFDQSSASKGVFDNQAATGAGEYASGSTYFSNSSTAAQGTFTNEGGSIKNTVGGETYFDNTSTAATATFINKGGSVSSGPFNGGGVEFLSTSTAASATFTNYGGSAAGSDGGDTSFEDSSSAGNASITNYGGSHANAEGGVTSFDGSSNADNATVSAYAGTNSGPGGVIYFTATATGGHASISVFGNADLDISQETASSVSIGSLSGSGNAFLGANNLTIGTNNTNTTFSGVIEDGGVNLKSGGSLTKTGTGNFILSGKNTYTGSTTISAGSLQVDGTLFSSPTIQSGGTLGGSGSVGNITLMSGGFLAPGDVLNNLAGTLSATSLSWNSGGTLLFDLGGSTSDYLSLTGALANGTGSSASRVFDFVNQGVTVGQKINLIGFGSENVPLTDFASLVGDGVQGTFGYQGDVLQFTVTNAPEPTTWVLFFIGFVGMIMTLKRPLCRSGRIA